MTNVHKHHVVVMSHWILYSSGCEVLMSLLAIIDKYGVSIRQWNWLNQALLEVLMTKISLWINDGVHDWTVERAIIAGNVSVQFPIAHMERFLSIRLWFIRLTLRKTHVSLFILIRSHCLFSKTYWCINLFWLLNTNNTKKLQHSYLLHC